MTTSYSTTDKYLSVAKHNPQDNDTLISSYLEKEISKPPGIACERLSEAFSEQQFRVATLMTDANTCSVEQ